MELHRRFIVNTYLFACILCSGLHGHPLDAQFLSVTLIAPPKPLNSIMEWQEYNEGMRLIVENHGTKPISCKTRTILRQGSMVVMYTRAADMGALQIKPGTMTILAKALVPKTALQIVSTNDLHVIRAGIIAPGHYTLVSQVIDAEDEDHIVSISQAVDIDIVGVCTPVLIEPMNYHAVSAAKTIRFSWIGCKPTPADGSEIRYTLLVYGAYKGADPTSVIETTEPILRKSISPGSALSIVLPAAVLTSSKSKEYVWTVQVTDLRGIPYGDHDGFADPAVFRLK